MLPGTATPFSSQETPEKPRSETLFESVGELVPDIPGALSTTSVRVRLPCAWIVFALRVSVWRGVCLSLRPRREAEPDERSAESARAASSDAPPVTTRVSSAA
ncbi:MULTISPECIES: hypothetical protein [Raoultella]|uniref:hypothetical protein n=1 Tax=Raoultella sp. BIGb0149 TaxID=2485116 RepID=UPI001FB83DE1|nr:MULTISPECIES: hypothetical protein [Raoultella]